MISSVEGKSSNVRSNSSLKILFTPGNRGNLSESDVLRKRKYMYLNGLNKVLSNKNINKFVVALLMLHVFNSYTATTEVLTIKKKENKFEILAVFESSTNICSTWKLITSYENLPSFLPRMVSSKILKNEGNKKVVRQVFKDNLFILDSTFVSPIKDDKPLPNPFFILELIMLHSLICFLDL